WAPHAKGRPVYQQNGGSFTSGPNSKRPSFGKLHDKGWKYQALFHEIRRSMGDHGGRANRNDGGLGPVQSDSEPVVSEATAPGQKASARVRKDCPLSIGRE